MIKKILIFSSSFFIFALFSISAVAEIAEHKQLSNLPDNPSPTQVTAECIKCHIEEAENFIKTSHWLWKGASPYTVKHTQDTQHGKATTAFNNY